MAVSKRLRFEIFRRDGFRCRYCGATPEHSELRPDHVVPEALGGKDEPSNLVTACTDCNSGKSSVLLESTTAADVNEYSFRWAEALAAAAEEMEHNRRAAQERHAWFRRAWASWTMVDGRAAVLPNDWPASVEAFLGAGLTENLMTDAVETAMSRHGIRERFAYFCGICWRLVDELHKSAKNALDDETNASTGESTWWGYREKRVILDAIRGVLDRCYELPHWVYDEVIVEVEASLEAMR